MALDRYYTLGRSGLRVSPLALGTMTFGEDGWGADRDTARIIFDRYLEAGGNFVDTADVYAGGRSEQILGECLGRDGIRDRVVLSTKFTLDAQPGDPNASGNNRKSMLRALEGSLRRLGTDYVDLYILHMHDAVTPVEEVVRGLDDLVRAGTVRYVAFSDVPAWYAAKAQTTSLFRGWEPLCALQMEYSLLERGAEFEFPGLCEDLGMSLMVWGPLANGLLSGKYKPTEALDTAKAGRLNFHSAHLTPEVTKINEHTWQVLAELDAVATELDRSMAQVAINWVANRRAVGSVITGASKVEQLDANLAALDFTIPEELGRRLDAVTALPRVMPYAFLARMDGRANANVVDKRPGYFARDSR